MYIKFSHLKNNLPEIFSIGFLASLFKLKLLFSPFFLISSYFLKDFISLKNINLNFRGYLLATIIIKLFIILGIFLFIKKLNYQNIYNLLAIDVILIFSIFLRLDERFMRIFILSPILLLGLDFIANLHELIVHFSNIDLGRKLSELIPRLGGIFISPYQSINISVAAFFSGVILKNRWIICVSIINLLINGSYRSILIFFMILLVLLFVKYNKFKNISLIRAVILLIILTPIFIACIYYLVEITAFTWTSGPGQIQSNGSGLRIYLWKNAILNIINDPIFGNSSFYNRFPHSGEDLGRLLLAGQAESMYLQLAVDFGVFAMLFQYAFFFLLVMNSVLKYSANNYHSSIILMASLLIYFDSFFGLMLMSVFTAYFYGFLLISFEFDFLASE